MTILRRLRESRGKKQNEVAGRTGIDPGFYSRMESGKSKVSLDAAQRLASFYGGEVTPLHLMLPEQYPYGAHLSESAMGKEAV